MPESRRWWVPLAIVLLAFAAYWPALQAGWIWDDDSYVTANAVVRSPEGIIDAWIPGRTPQYYPLVFASFWVQHAVHGLDPFGYHLVNLLLHLGSSLLLWRLLLRLGVPGAGIAAALFALHPMQVESVAWVTERKNTLSMLLALASVLAWVRWADDPRPFRERAGWWGASFGLFVLAMLSKTTAVAVPVALVAVELWRGRPLGRRTVALLAPYFVVGVALGLVTAYLEATHVGARGAEFDRSALERCLQGAMAWWFYLRTWAFPNELTFIYSRFEFGAGAWRAWCALAAFGVLLIAAVLRWRRGHRGALLLLAIYSAGVFPALGFINVYPLRYAPVADHFAYVASTAMAIATGWLAAAVMHRLRARGIPAVVGPMAAGATACGLAVMVHAQAVEYVDAPTLWRATLERNPQAWIAANNLCHDAIQRAQAALDHGDHAASEALIAEASVLAEQAMASGGAIDMPMLGNLSEVRRVQGRLPEALDAIDRAIALQPEFGGTRWQRGRLLEQMGRVEEAGPEYAAAVERDGNHPTYLRAHAQWLARAGQLMQARQVAAHIAALEPENPETLYNLGMLSLELGDVAEARLQLESALRRASEPYATLVAVRLAVACMTPPVDARASNRALLLAQAVVRNTGSEDPLALMLLARAQAWTGSPKEARETLARADAQLVTADAATREAAGQERLEVEAALAARAAMPR